MSKKENKDISFNEQGFLIWDHFIKRREKDKFSKLGEGKSGGSGVTLHKVKGNYTNVNFVSKLMKKENIDLYKYLVDLETRKLTSLVPEIKLYKIENQRYVPFYFPINAENTSMHSLLQPGASLGGSGIKNFDVKFVGKDFFTRDKMIECNLSIFVDSVENIFKEPPAGYATLADLFTISREKGSFVKSGSNKKVSSSMVNRTTSHEIGAFMGYATDPHSNILTTREKRAIENTALSLRMTYTGHDISVAQNGTAEITISYIGRLSGVLGDPLYDVLASDEELELLSLIRAESSGEKSTDSAKEKEEKLKSIFKKTTRDVFNEIFNILEEENKVHSSVIEVDDMYAYNLYVGRQVNPILGRRLKHGDKSAKPKGEVDTGLASDNPEEVKALQWSTGTPTSTDLVTTYVYMGDFIQAVIYKAKNSLQGRISEIKSRTTRSPAPGMKPLTQEAASKIIKPLQDAIENLKTFKILFGKVAISIGETSSIYVNLADIPITKKMIGNYAFNTIEQNYRKKLTLRSFLNDVVYKLYPLATTKHLYRDAQTLPSKFEIKSTTITGEEAKILNRKNPEVSISDLPDFLKSLNQNRKKSDDVEYLIFYSEASSDMGSGLSGNVKKDSENGVYHFHLSKDRGLIKSINFSMNNIRFRKEALMIESVDLYDELKMPYNANITMVGNNLFLPGALLYINPASIGFGDPRNRRSAAARLGLGGYYIVTSVATKFASGKLETSLETQYHSWADEDPSATTSEILQNTGVFEKAKRIVERNTGKKSPVQRIY